MSPKLVWDFPRICGIDILMKFYFIFLSFLNMISSLLIAFMLPKKNLCEVVESSVILKMTIIISMNRNEITCPSGYRLAEILVNKPQL